MKLFYFVMFLFNGFVSAVSSANENAGCSFHLHLLWMILMFAIAFFTNLDLVFNV